MNAPIHIELTMLAASTYADRAIARPATPVRDHGMNSDPAPVDAGLTSEEIAVIAIGRADAASFWWRGSATSSGWHRRLLAILRWTIGLRGVQSLASERLETLRLLTCMVARRDRQVRVTAKRLTALGMTPAAVRQAIHRAEGRTVPSLHVDART